MNRNTRLIVLVLVAAVLVTSVQAATVSEAFSGALNSFENFFSGGWQQHEKSLAFMIVFVLFFSAFMIGAKKAFGEMNRPVVAFCVTAALLSATILVITSNFTLVRFGIIASGLLFLMVMAVVHTLLMKMGMEKTGWSLVLAFLITAALFGLVAALSGEGESLSELGGPFRWLDGLGDGVSSGSSGSGSSGGSSGDGFFSKVGGWFKDIFSGSGSSSGTSGGSDAGAGSSGTSAPAGTSAERTQQARERAQQIIRDEPSGSQGGGWFDWFGNNQTSMGIGSIVILIIILLLLRRGRNRPENGGSGQLPSPPQFTGLFRELAQFLHQRKERKQKVVAEIVTGEENKKKVMTKLGWLSRKARIRGKLNIDRFIDEFAPYLADPESEDTKKLDAEAKGLKRLVVDNIKIVGALRSLAHIEEEILLALQRFDDHLQKGAFAEDEAEHHRIRNEVTHHISQLYQKVREIIVHLHNYFNIEVLEGEAIDHLRLRLNDPHLIDRIKRKWISEVVHDEGRLKRLLKSEFEWFAEFKVMIHAQNTYLGELGRLLDGIDESVNDVPGTVTGVIVLPGPEDWVIDRPGDPPEPTGDSFPLLAQLNPQQIFEILEDEPVDVIAVVLLDLPRDRSSAAWDIFTEEKQREIEAALENARQNHVELINLARARIERKAGDVIFE